MSINLHIHAKKTIKLPNGETSKIQNVIVFLDGSSHMVKIDLTIKFKDSFLFLPIALRKLARTFMVSLGKGISLSNYLIYSITE